MLPNNLFSKIFLTTTLKTDKEVVRNLENNFLQSLREAEKAIENDDEVQAREKLEYCQDLKGIRGYETISDKKYDEIFFQYLERFFS